MKKLVVLGSTGSIGQQTLDIARVFPDVFRVVGLAAGTSVELLQAQIHEFQPEMVYCASGQQLELPPGARWASMEDMTTRDDVDLVMAATIGTAGLLPTFRALECGKRVALANKEVIVMAGELLKATEKRYGGAILPVDSEPSAIWQCMQGEPNSLRRIIITASGGPFRTTDIADLEGVTPEQALKHPTWQMGRKITVDSATLINKAFEVIESHWLFALPFEKIEVVVHPQSVVHSMIELADNSIKAQMGPPDMRLPIQYSMFHPDRMPNDLIPRLDIANPYSLTFQPLELERYPCFSLALDAGKRGGTYPAALSAADEVAVGLFLDRKIGYVDIGRVIERVLEEHDVSFEAGLDELVEVDRWARSRANYVAKLLAK
jgi:1-deoxy-D-xylulose-5-phosphate reductoisomerase